MQRIKIDLNKLNDSDSIKRFVEKERSEELSPMDPPDAYSPPSADDVDYEQMNDVLKKFIDDHKACLGKLDVFENALNNIRINGFGGQKEVSGVLSEFFQFVDNNIRKHNLEEEKFLFPPLNQRYNEKGEHSTGPDKTNAVDMLEDDHIKFIQIAAITFTMFGLAGRLPDQPSRLVVLDIAIKQGKKMVEMLRLHIFREDKIVFPFAQLNLTKNEFVEIKSNMDRLFPE